MKSTQDRIPTHQLGNEMALDAQGRVLRRPHFLTRTEHDKFVTAVATSWATLVTEEKRRARLTADMKVSEMTVLHSRIFCRSRLHWLLRLLIK